MKPLTPHQKWALCRLARMTRASMSSQSFVERAQEGFVLGKDVGAPAAMEHLARKGYVERKIEIGPRGGEHKLYRPSLAGWAAEQRYAQSKAVIG